MPVTQSEKIRRVVDEVAGVIIGKRSHIEMIMCAILAEGHVLIEDIPGVGKTTLALAFAAAMGLEQRRMQFTPDILPSDITGFTLYSKETGKFVYQQGAVMCNLFLADEINRTSAKTQSALLEVMEEGTVTVDGETHPVPQPFIVIATENPVGYSGTQMLPESQLDRFAICEEIGYPDEKDELQILKVQAHATPLNDVRTIITRNELIQMQHEVKYVTVQDCIYEYMVRLSAATRKHPGITLGLSTRGTLAVAAVARASAYMSGRDYVIPEDVERVFESTARHRVILSSEAKMNRQSVQDILREILRTVEKPLPERMKFRG